MTKNDLKLVAKLWISTVCSQNDFGYVASDVGLTEDEQNTLADYIRDFGVKLSKDHDEAFTSVKDIVEYVYNKYYE